MTSVSDREILKRIGELDPTSFENLTVSLLRAAGFRNLVWRTPGADGGRDIEGMQTVTDLSGSDFIQKWYIECKRYSSSVDWPTMWKKVAYADSHAADFLLLVTNSQPSPQCESEIKSWNDGRRRPSIRVWRGYDLPRFLRLNEDVAIAHGIVERTLTTSSFAVELASVISGLAQAAHSAWAFEMSPEIPLVSATSLSELLHQRLQSISAHGRFVPGAKVRDLSDWPWLRVSGYVDRQEEVSFRAIVATIRHVMQAEKMVCIIDDDVVRISASSSKLTLNSSTEEFLSPVLCWALCDAFRVSGERDLIFSLRPSDERA